MVRRPLHVLVPLDPHAAPVPLFAGRTSVPGGAVLVGPDGGVVVVAADGSRVVPRLRGPVRIGTRWWSIESASPAVGSRPEPTNSVEELRPTPPVPPNPIDQRPTFGLAPVLVPALLGCAVGLAVRPELALLGLIGPSGALVSRAQERRRRHRAAKRTAADHARAVEAHRRALAAWAERRSGDARLAAPGGMWAAWVCRRGLATQPLPSAASPGGWVARLGTVSEPEGHTVPWCLELQPGTVLGLAGPRAATEAMVRSLAVQLLARSSGDLTWTGANITGIDGLDAEAPVAIPGDPPTTVLRIHGTTGGVLGMPATATSDRGDDGEGSSVLLTIASAHRADRLPAGCEPVVQLRSGGDAVLLARGEPARPLAPDVLDERSARRAVRAVRQRRRSSGIANAGEVDPIEVPEPEQLAQRWVAARSEEGRALRAELGRADARPWVVDLVADGPHVLVGGTTGSGKSGVLRSLVLGLALAHPPDDVVLLLVDYKGGSAFDGLGALPHVVDVVTDLDRSLAERALQCLTAELRRRERLLRQVGCSDLVAYRRWLTARWAGAVPPARMPRTDDADPSPGEALPRIVVVVDELAALVDDLPALVPALVAVAQRGRSLGVHLVLATQRPSGVIRADLRANVDLRIALRVLEAPESIDLVGSPAAAALPRAEPGVALVRRSGERPVLVRAAPCPPDRVAAGAESVRAAWEGSGGDEPRSPWPAPLPDDLVPAPGIGALVDEPEVPRVRPWLPPTAGVCVLVGPTDAGTEAGLAALAGATAASADPGDLAVVLLDGAGTLCDLEDLAAVCRRVAPGDIEGRWRLARALVEELEWRARRTGSPEVGSGDLRTVLVVVSGLASLLAGDDPADPSGLRAVLCRLATDGPALGIGLWAAADREPAVPGPILAAAADLVRVGRAAPGSSMGPGVGRGVHAATGHRIQLAIGPAPVAPALPGTERQAPPDATTMRLTVRRLPSPVTSTLLASFEEWARPERGAGGDHELVVGVDDERLGPAWLPVGPGSPAVVLGRPGAHRTAVLRTIARAAAGQGLRVVHLADGGVVAPPDGVVGRGVLTVVDGADRCADPDGRLEGLVADPDALLVVAARPEGLRGRYGHWTAGLRRSRCGLLLPPWSEVDGDLLGVVVPRRLRPGAPPDLALLVRHGRVCAVRTPGGEGAASDLGRM